MNCHDTRRWLSPYLDSELGATKTFEVSEHLRRCGDCKDRFAAERRADELVRSRLEQDTMPPELWSALVRDVRTPAWSRRLRRRWVSASAACLLLAVLGVVGVWSMGSGAGDAGDWAVRAFVAATDDGKDFDAHAQEAGSPERLLLEKFGIRIERDLIKGNFGPHAVSLVSATTRTDRDGRAYLELRLKCCGYPVLMALAAFGEGDPPAPFEGAALAPARATRRVGDVHIATRRIDGVAVMAVSRHSVEQLVASLRIVKA